MWVMMMFHKFSPVRFKNQKAKKKPRKVIAFRGFLKKLERHKTALRDEKPSQSRK